MPQGNILEGNNRLGWRTKGTEGTFGSARGVFLGAVRAKLGAVHAKIWAGDVSLITNLNYFVSIWMSKIGFKGSQAEAEIKLINIQNPHKVFSKSFLARQLGGLSCPFSHRGKMFRIGNADSSRFLEPCMPSLDPVHAKLRIHEPSFACTGRQDAPRAAQDFPWGALWRAKAP